jgi:very-short-patch-repair endonuclease
VVLEKTEQARSESAFRRARAKVMRREPTEAEKRFWWEVKDRRLYGHKFRRQRAIGPFIVDFVCLERHLVVEIDGGQHLEAADYDAQRSAILEAHGFRVVRFWNSEVLMNMEGVIDAVLAELGGEAGSPSP